MFVYANKDRYSGQWREDLRHGQGTYVFEATKFKLKGKWCQGAFEGGEWAMSVAQKFEGGFARGKPDGPGKWTVRGQTFAGEYRNAPGEAKTEEVLPIKNYADFFEPQTDSVEWIPICANCAD